MKAKKIKIKNQNLNEKKKGRLMVYFIKYRKLNIVLISQEGSVYANGPGERGSILGRVIPKT